MMVEPTSRLTVHKAVALPPLSVSRVVCNIPVTVGGILSDFRELSFCGPCFFLFNNLNVI